tara:strand:+ start:3582 stop:3989 length:408 start_codon:yes stop_codon:yes gene_type:complete
MNKNIILFLIAFIIFSIIDLIWLAYVGRPIYVYYLGGFLRENPIWSSAIIFYIFFIIGMIVFVIRPAIKQLSYRYALSYGSFYGFITYMTYELTNHAVIKAWPFGIVLIDIAWGAILSALVSVLSLFFYRFFRLN